MNLQLGLGITSRFVAGPPTAASLSFSQVDLLGGGSDIVVTGTNLSGATVTVGGTSATVTGTTGTTVNFQAPTKIAGTYDVVVTTVSGSATLTSALEYWAPSTETGCTLLIEKPNYAVNAGTGTWTTRVGSVAPTQATSPPSAVGGEASFADQELLADTIGNLMTMTGTPEGSFGVVANMSAASAPSGTTPQSTGIWADKARGAIEGQYTTNGLSFIATDGTYKTATVPWATGAEHAGCGRFKSGDVIQASVDGSAFASASSAIGTYSAATTQTVTIGRNFGTGSPRGFTGIMRAFCMFNKKVSDAFATKFYKWAQQRHGVT